MKEIASTVIVSMLFIILVACAGAPSGGETTQVAGWTGDAELDGVIEIVLLGDTEALRSIINFTDTQCTHEMGLGGPPKCLEGEAEGTRVEVLPILGPEGIFIRREDIQTWEGLRVSEVYAAYKVSDSAYSDPNFPAGTHAIVFASGEGSSITLQVVDGQIMRIDEDFGTSPDVPPDWVEEYLLAPAKDEN